MKQDGIEKLEKENPDLDWWFAKVEESGTTIIKKIDECRNIDKEDDRKYALFFVS